MTRNHKLKVKITLKAAKQQIFREVLDDINSQVTDNKIDGKKMTKIRFINDTGVSFNSRIDVVDLKDVALEDALDKLFKKNDSLGLGYIVVIGKPNEQNDGAVKIVKGENRGYPTGVEPKKK